MSRNEVDTLNALQFNTSKAFTRNAFGGAVCSLRLPDEVAHMVFSDFVLPQLEYERLHAKDVLQIMVGSGTDDDASFSLLHLSKEQCRRLELHLNLQPWTFERKVFGDVLYNFHARNHNIVFEISAAMFAEIQPLL